MMSMRLCVRPNYSVKVRVLAKLGEFPSTVRELESAGCGSTRSIRRVLQALRHDGDVIYFGSARYGGRRYALRRGDHYVFLGEKEEAS